ncbi:helix-turn-helix domain-containing protein [Nocardioides sp. MAH-18]|uniref:Helix-turn-helix domain-containing protein n=1 Tax=Nocardioides agri TaxID=2682843 RepID=A0A6L6XLA9_9ACTN|nr:MULTISPECIES: AraC family transcriptional regulator [unclassified Nocardioides]MBA2956525.1 AraC family transcriptional regulator ligand-binding domain-containing protein [Nocardioides sp. CGMCC 1.13656]MVQ47672.1 helix-turn-helix domain-containing protein [Nocardioides sp. MAH-18]
MVSGAVRFEQAAVRDWDFARAASGVRLLVDHARDRGLADDDLLAGSGLTVAGLDAATEVTAAQELRVVRNLRGRLGEVGEEVGRRYRAATFGVLGYALVSSRTVLDAMNVALRFLDLSHTFAIPTASVEGDVVRIVVGGAGLPADVRRFLVDRDAAAIRAVLREIVPGGIDLRSARDGDAVVVTLPLADLDRRLSRADTATRAVSEAVCRDVVARRRARTGLAGEVRVLVTQQLSSGAPMAGVAGALGVSERTLRRRLAADGTSYQRLLDEVRESLAVELLRTLPVQDVALRLGYAEASSFIVGFRRWTGRTPTS